MFKKALLFLAFSFIKPFGHWSDAVIKEYRTSRSSVVTTKLIVTHPITVLINYLLVVLSLRLFVSISAPTTSLQQAASRALSLLDISFLPGEMEQIEQSLSSFNTCRLAASVATLQERNRYQIYLGCVVDAESDYLWHLLCIVNGTTSIIKRMNAFPAFGRLFWEVICDFLVVPWSVVRNQNETTLILQSTFMGNLRC